MRGERTERRPRRRGAPVVERVLEVTLEELGRVGFAGLSVPRVAARARLNKTSVYRRWPTKVALVRAAMEAALARQEPVTQTGALKEDLVAVALAVGRFIASPTGASVLRVMLGDAPKALRVKATSAWETQERLVPRLALDRARREGTLAPGVDPARLLFALAGAVIHRVVVERAPA